ncbi:caspase family protein [Flammeovirga sp. EKP202]|uniref:caspase family protein n=1 Tax=Flammeovirga sp. EKP202 TaxID=2770592 RepID=UPI00165ED1D6|nr:caspase family protein [Flammeovirga sp. EKP202]MBD0401362.1 caspase family protein [Flammeovirga sp. EKP202]
MLQIIKFLPLYIFFIIITNITFGQKDVFLRLNNEMHLEEISDVCQSSKYYFTTSQDKTIKVWDITTGDLIKTLRVPIGEGLIGKLFACAVSNDESILAVGGYTGEHKKNKSIYLFNIQTWEIKQVIAGLPNVVSDLAFHPNNDLIVSFYSNAQVGIFGLKSGIYYKKKVLNQFEDEIRSINFGPKNQVLITSLDGNIYIFDQEYNFKTKFKTKHEAPKSLVLNKEKNLATIIFLNSPEITQYHLSHGGELKFKKDITIKNAHRINTLFSTSNDNLMFSYSDSLSKLKQNIAVFHPTKGFTKRLSIGNGNINLIRESKGHYLFFSTIPKIVAYDKTFNAVYQKNSHHLDYFHSKMEDFGINEKANIITIKNKDEKLSFDINTRSFIAPENHYYIAKEGRNNTTVSNWNYSMYPMINNDTVQFINNYEFCQAVDVSQDGNFVALGTHRGIYYLTKENKRLWHVDSPSPVVNIIITPDQKKIVAFTQDGSIRWYNTNFKEIKGVQLKTVKPTGLAYRNGIRQGDIILSVNNYPVQDKKGLSPLIQRKGSYKFSIKRGDEVKEIIIDKNTSKFGFEYAPKKKNDYLLSLFIDPTNLKWIFYTKDGFYDTSIGAEKYLGWHVNISPRITYFYDVSRLRDTYYHPDTINTLMAPSALQLNSRSINNEELIQKLPPVVKIKYPSMGEVVSSTNLQLQYTARSLNGSEIEEIKVMINGKTVEQSRGLQLKEDEVHLMNITLPKEDCFLLVIAKNENGWSEPSSVMVKWSGKKETAPKPNLYLLSIGVSDYMNGGLDLKYGAKDANDFKSIIQAQQGGLYENVYHKLLTDSEATKGNILDALEWIQNETTSKDVAMIFMAGHGMNDRNGAFYYLPHDSDLNSIRRTCLSFIEFKYTISTIPGKAILFIDTCHSGNVINGARSTDFNLTKTINELSDAENGAVVFTSSTGTQLSVESDQWKNGAFTEALIEGLRGKADQDQKGVIYVKALDWYLSRRVKELTSGKQSPTSIIPYGVTDFPIFVE